MSDLQRVMNHMRLQAALAANAVGRPRHGLVSSYDPENYLVKVRIQPEDVETGWLPIQVLLAGSGWGIYAGPNIGDQACVLYLEEDAEVGWCVGFLPNEVDRPPNVPSGEIQVIHKTGGSLKFQAGGVVNLVAPGGFNVTANTTITGTLHVTQAVTLDSDLTVGGNVTFSGSSVTHGGVNIGKTHKHGGVQAGSSVSNVPQ